MTKIVTSQSFCFVVQQVRCNLETTEPITLQAGQSPRVNLQHLP